MNPIKAVAAVLASVVLASAPAISTAQGSYPVRPVTWVIPYAAGGATDVAARIVARRLSEDLGQQVVVANKPGAGTMIGAQFVARAPADGYTLLAAVVANLVTAPLLSQTSPGYDPARDFEPISLISANPLLLVASAKSEFKSFADVLRKAKEKPGEVAIASYGQGTPSHLAIELLKSVAAIDVLHVPYNGAAPAMVDVMGGRVPLMMDILPGQLKGMERGEVTGLAIGQASRSAQAPNVPTFREGGLAGFEATTWFGIVAPAGTPKEIVERLNLAVRKTLTDPQVQQMLMVQGMPTQPTSPQEFGAMIRADYAKWGAVIKAANLAGR